MSNVTSSRRVTRLAAWRRKDSSSTAVRRRHWRRTIWQIGAVGAVAVLLVVAFVQKGFPTTQVDLNDGSVWITNSKEMKVGRFNQPIEELTNGLVAPQSGFDVHQDATDIIVSSPSGAQVVDPALVTTDAPVALPGKSRMSTASHTAAVVEPASGDVWVRTVEAFQGLRTGTDAPDVKLAGGGLAVAAPDGSVVSVDARGSVMRTTIDGTAAHTEDVGKIKLDGSVDALTTVGTDVFALSGSTLSWDGGSVDLSSYGPTAVLQQPGPDADYVAVATELKLLTITRSGDVTEHDSGSSGAPAQPVNLNGCLHAAWAAEKGNYLRLCDGSKAVAMNLDDVRSTSKLVFRVNRDVVLLNDTVDGRIWLPLKDEQVRQPNWNIIEPEKEKTETEDDDDVTQNLLAECTESSGSPKANNDSYGVRENRSRVLTVLDNDSSTDCGALAIANIEAPPEDQAKVEIVYDGRALQYTPVSGAPETVSFTYTISDGRKNSATSSATVTVSAKADSVNSPPVADRHGKLQVEQGAEGHYDVLTDFSDPDGDSLALVGAATDTGLTVRSTPDGQLTVIGSGDVGTSIVNLTVSDGRDSVSSQFTVEVRAPGSLPPVIDPITLKTYVDRPVTVEATNAVRTASVEPAELAGIKEEPGATIVPHTDKGTFTFTAATPKTYYLQYTIIVGSQQAVGIARIDVEEFPQANPPPVAVSDVAYIPDTRITVIDPLVNDLDPSGGVPVLSSVSAAPELGMKVAILDHHFVQVTPTRQLAAPTTISYTLGAAGQQAEGQITLVPVPGSVGQPPILKNIEATVRTGGVVTVDVMDYAVDPDGDKLTLMKDSVKGLPKNDGLLFVSGDKLRYQAPNEPKTVEAPFTVRDPQGNEATAVLTVRAHASAKEGKQPAKPADVQARTFEDQTVRIPIRLTGIDADGDGVTLLGVDQPPTKGRITEVGPDYLLYQALPGELGTDSFTYAVEDWVGVRATASIEVGIAPDPNNVTAVVAQDDAVTVRPGENLQVRVLANDIDLAGGLLELCGKPEVSDSTVAVKYDGHRVSLKAPEKAGVLQIGYSACNERGGQDDAALRITVDPNAPFLPPIARDVVVPPRDTIEKASVDVDVLAVADNPSGSMSDLKVSVHPTASDVASLNKNQSIKVKLGPEPRTLPFVLTNTRPEAKEAVSYAFITVPALGDFPPMLRPGGNKISVPSGQTIEISLQKYVRVGAGKTARITTETKVSATKAADGPLVKDDKTLLYTSQPNYAGPASITFEVTDGKSGANTDGRTATLTLPISVTGGSKTPPVLSLPRLELPAGDGARTVDLTQFTKVSGEMDPSKLTYQLTSAVPGGFTAKLDGNKLTVSATTSAKRGAVGTVEIRAKYGSSEPGTGTMELEAVASQRRLVSLGGVPDQIVNEGDSKTVNVLAGALNPFPGEAMTVSGATSSNGDGAQVGASAGNVTVNTRKGFIGSLRVTYTVNDVLKDPAREVTGNFTVTVRGKPDRPSTPVVRSVGPGRVDLTWAAPANNGAPITEYRVEYSGGSQSCSATACTVTGLTNGSNYSFRVSARNEVGWSEASEGSKTQLVDVSPGQIGGAGGASQLRAQEGDGQVTVSWSPPPNEGSAITGYDVRVTGGPGARSAETGSTSYTANGLSNGSSYSFEVRAKNRAEAPGPWSSPVSAVPFGRPGVPGNVIATVQEQGERMGIEVAWGDASANGRPIDKYTVKEAGGQEISVAPGTGNTAFFAKDDVANGKLFSYTVTASNAAGPGEAGASPEVSWKPPPSTPTVTSVGQTGEAGWSVAPGQGSIRVNWTSDGRWTSRFRVSLSGGSCGNAPSGGIEVGASSREATFTGCSAGQVGITVTAINSAGSGGDKPSTSGTSRVSVTTQPQFRSSPAARVMPGYLQIEGVNDFAPNGTTDAEIYYRTATNEQWKQLNAERRVPYDAGAPPSKVWIMLGPNNTQAVDQKELTVTRSLPYTFTSISSLMLHGPIN